MKSGFPVMASLLFGLFSLVFIYACSEPNPEGTVKIVLDVRENGKAIPEDYIGLSYETKVLLPDNEGKYYFSPGNKALVSVFRSLGIKNLRIGGNSVDVAYVPVPAEKDIDELFAFAKEAGVKVIYSVRLQDGDPQSAARLAKHIYTNYAGLLDYFAVGNEPGYYKDYENQLRPRWESIMQAMREVAPTARFCAPDDNPNPELCQKMLRDFGAPKGPVSLISFHSYPGDCAYKNPFKAATVADLIPHDAGEKRELLLSAKMPEEYEKVYRKMEPVIGRFPYRLTETNSIWYGGLEGASNSYASALWGLDYMYWWAARGAGGINFHTGDMVGGGDKSVPSRYAVFVTEGKGFDMRPLSYAIKAFSLGFDGRLAPVSLSENTENLTAYATRKDDGFFYVTIVNKNHGSAVSTKLELTFTDNAKVNGEAEYLLLEAPDGDISLKKGVTLGGQAISERGGWENPSWNRVKSVKGAVHASIPAASAVILKFKVTR